MRRLTFVHGLAIAWVMVGGSPAWGQRPRPDSAFDTAYVHDYSHILATRVYLSTKDNRMVLGSVPGAQNLVYQPNNRINMGVGASYRAITLNLGFPVPGINADDEVVGRTRYLDAQANILTQRTATNLFLQGFSGYYVSSHGHDQVNWPADHARPYRPDVRQFNLGVSTVRILNSDRFSYRASFNQDAWQRRSQGSWLIGGYATWFTMIGDSSLVPTALREEFTAAMDMRRGTFADLGPMGGYAYTLVWRAHWFLTISGVAGAGLSGQWLRQPQGEGERLHRRAGPGWHAQVRASMGYNSRRWYAGVGYNQERIGYLLEGQRGVQWMVSNLRFNVVRRFNTRIPFMDRRIHWFRKNVQRPVEEALPDIPLLPGTP